MTVAENLAGITVTIGFGTDTVGGNYFVLNDPVRGVLDNATYLIAPDTTFVDVTDHVATIDITRGRDRELDEYGTGIATITFNDNDRTFDPAYTGSPYYGEIVPMKRVNVKWRGWRLFTGWIDDWTVTYEPADVLSRVVADCVDGFAILANQELDTIAPSYAGDLAGERISRVLNRDEVDYPLDRSIATGNSILGATTLGGNALAYLQACSKAEAGFLFVSADGELVFRGRNVNLTDGWSSVIFSDDRTTGIPYENVTQRSTSDLLYTRVTGETETVGTPLFAVDSLAKARFKIRNLALGSLFTSTDVQTQNIIDYQLSRYSSVEERFHTATLNTAALATSEVEQITALDLTNRVTVKRSPLGIGPTITRLSIVDGIRHRIARHGQWVTELAFANADTRTVFILDDTDFGRLDENRLTF